MDNVVVMGDDTETTIKEVEYGIQRIWYAMCICLADILDADHDLSRKGNDENPLETYWVKYKSSMIKASVDELWSKLPENVTDPRMQGLKDRLNKIIGDINNYYSTHFISTTTKRTQHKIHGLFVQLINSFGPKFQDIDGNGVPRTALSVSTFSSGKGINEQRKKIKEVYELEDLMVETHRGGDYVNKDDSKVILHKYTPSTIFDLGSNSGFVPFAPSPPSFSLNYFPGATTIMTTVAAAKTSTDLALVTWLNNITNAEVLNLPVLIHTFLGENGPTYSVQFGPVTADEVTYELYGQNRRSLCAKINPVQNMIFSNEGSILLGDILARKCHIIYGKTCGDGVSIDGALQMGCGVLSNDICCCYRAAIVNGYGFRPCPTASKIFSTVRNIEVVTTKPKGVFNLDKASTNVNALLNSFKYFDNEKNIRKEYINKCQITGNTKIPYLQELFDKKKNFFITELDKKTIPEDLKTLYQKEPSQRTLPEDLLKRYCNYNMDQCLGSTDFYAIELKQMIVDIKSNVDKIKALKLPSRKPNEIDCFEQSLSIIGNIELVLSSFLEEKDVLEYSRLFFSSNLAAYNGKSFLSRYAEHLNNITQNMCYSTFNLTNYIVGWASWESKKAPRGEEFSEAEPSGKKRRLSSPSASSSGGDPGVISLIHHFWPELKPDIDMNEEEDVIRNEEYVEMDKNIKKLMSELKLQKPELAEKDIESNLGDIDEAKKELNNLFEKFRNVPQASIDNGIINEFHNLSDMIDVKHPPISTFLSSQSVPLFNFINNPSNKGFNASMSINPSKNKAVHKSVQAYKHLPIRLTTPSASAKQTQSKRIQILTSKSLKSLKSLHPQLHHSQSQQRPPWRRGGSKKKRRRKPILTRKNPKKNF